MLRLAAVQSSCAFASPHHLGSAVLASLAAFPPPDELLEVSGHRSLKHVRVDADQIARDCKPKVRACVFCSDAGAMQR